MQETGLNRAILEETGLNRAILKCTGLIGIGPDKKKPLLSVIGLLVALLAPFQGQAQSTGENKVDADGYVGSQTCAACHDDQYQRWKGSHHDWAMQPATEKTVLGNFNNARFKHYGQKSVFSKRDGKFFVKTENAEGKLQKFEIAYTFGFYPLQQYLIAFEDGRYQALSLAWDSRTKKEGGQRWFHLYPDEAIPHDDQLHWTGTYQNWNSRCAECHSTNLKKNYDLETDSYQTNWSEINVACEACHGPGKEHLEWANAGADASLTGRGFHWNLGAVGSWVHQQGAPTAQHKKGENEGVETTSDLGRQIDTCGGCHSRRSIIGDEHQGAGFNDTYTLSLPQTPLYHVDGQILDEDYVVGSFLQSKMFHKGVVCSNCHDPHSLELRAPGNNVCAQCHNPNVFDSSEHHHHTAESSGALCANCHMPETTYMVVDPRRDHSVRIPRPDLSLKYQTPNACTKCHTRKSDQWAADGVTRWLKASNKTLNPHFSEQLAAGQAPTQAPTQNADVSLMQLAMAQTQPGIARAAALAQLQNHPSPQALLTAQTNLSETDSLVRRAAVDAMALVSLEQRITDLWPMINDPVKTVRMGVAMQLAGVDEQQFSTERRKQLQALFEEYRVSLLKHADMPATQINLGVFYSARNQLQDAEKAYRHAMKLDKRHIAARLNLADLYRQLNRENEGEALLREALDLSPKQASVHHALGLLLVRQKRYEEALSSLKQAASLAPDDMRYGYIYAVALNSQGKSPEAIKRLKALDRRHPNQPELLMALVDMLGRQKKWEQALVFAEQLQKLQPENQQLQQWIGYLRQQVR